MTKNTPMHSIPVCSNANKQATSDVQKYAIQQSGITLLLKMKHLKNEEFWGEGEGEGRARVGWAWTQRVATPSVD